MTSSNSILEPALNLFEAKLEIFAISPDYPSNMMVIFGEGHDYTLFQTIFNRKNTGVLTLIEIVPIASLNGAYGAFSRETNKIYLASEFINFATPSAIADVLLEEYGHYIDAQLNPIETTGDEGEIFADLVQGNPLDPAAFTEDDTEIVNIKGNWITVEQAAGDLDPTFGGGGVAVSPFTGSPIGVVVQPDGKIIVGGEVNIGNTDFGIVRFNGDGTIDTSFGNVGIAINDFSDKDTSSSIALQADGKILLGGGPNDGTQRGAVIRYNGDGTIDTSFGNQGIIIIDFYSSFGTAAGTIGKIEVQPDGKILVIYGRVATFGFGGFISETRIDRYNSNGSLDTSFGDSGGVQISDESTDGDLAIQSDGKILAAVNDGVGSNPSVIIERLEANGSFDASWGVNGSVTTPITLDNYGLGSYLILAIQPDGKIFIAGESILARYNPNGSLDKMLTTTDKILGLTVQDNGKIALLHEDGLSRFNSDLTPDNTFGNGITRIPSPVGASEIHNLTLQSDGKILVAGDVNGSLSLARYQGDVFDPTQYGASYPDLIIGIGYNLDGLAQHYQNSGRLEGRQQDLFDEYRYIASNADLIGVFGLNGAGATYHYITAGYYEGRSLTSFIPSRYLNSHPDLYNAFGTDTLAATQHYITNGFAEGRNPNSFLSDRYIASYADLIQVYRYNLEAGSNHYLFSGRTEGRQISFSPEAYLSRYGDLQAAFGNDLNAATAHYITTGFDEGRTWM